MQSELTLHCFPGDASSMAILLLADYLGLDLKVRYLKPVNVAEKFYKTSLTKKFPMLEVGENDGHYLIERSNCIMRFLTDSAAQTSFTDKKQYSYAIGNQNLDYISNDIMPALLTLKALAAGIIEEDDKLEDLLLKELKERFYDLELIISNQEHVELNHSDFLLFVMYRTALDISKLQKQLNDHKIFNHRWQKVSGDDKFKSLCSPFAPRS